MPDRNGDQGLHTWDLTTAQARELQAELAEQLLLRWDDRVVSTVGGVDVAIKGDIARAAIVVLSFPELSPVAAATTEMPLSFLYVPGLLSFREAPSILDAWERLPTEPDLVMFDGQGIAHPRGIGLAAHLGLWLQRPTIGVAKSRLYGMHEEPGPEKGDWSPLIDQCDTDRLIGGVLRTRRSVKPVYVSPGHLIDVRTSLRFVLDCATKYRLPETTRWAHRVAGGAQLD